MIFRTTARSVQIRVLDPRRIIIFRPGAIGDTLVTFPALKLLRERFPDATITGVGNRPALAVARAAGLIDHVGAFGADWVSDLFGDETTAALQSRLVEVDLGIVWLYTPEAARDLASRLERAGVRATHAASSFPPVGSGCHLADHLIETLAPLGIPAARPLVRLTGPPARRPGAEDRMSGQSAFGPAEHLAVLHPGAGARRKRWPAERFAVLADRLADARFQIALTTGPSDDDVAPVVRAAARHASIRILEGRSLVDLADVFGGAHLFVGNDSGITHLAALAGAPTLAIFGPFDPAYWLPLGPRVAAIDAGSACPHRADPREGCRVCDRMALLSVDQVWEAVNRLLAGAPTE